MVDNSLPHSHLHKDDLHDSLTYGHGQQSRPVRLEATPSSLSDTSVTSMLHIGAVALPIGTLFGGNHTSVPSSISEINIQHNYGSAPADGDQVWYCSACGDGPISIWQNVCVVCSHQKCGACILEET